MGSGGMSIEQGELQKPSADALAFLVRSAEMFTCAPAAVLQGSFYMELLKAVVLEGTVEQTSRLLEVGRSASLRVRDEDRQKLASVEDLARRAVQGNRLNVAGSGRSIGLGLGMGGTRVATRTKQPSPRATATTAAGDSSMDSFAPSNPKPSSSSSPGMYSGSKRDSRDSRGATVGQQKFSNDDDDDAELSSLFDDDDDKKVGSKVSPAFNPGSYGRRGGGKKK